MFVERRSSLVKVEEGEFAGWRLLPRESFEYTVAGPFYSKKEADGSVICAFRGEKRHMNSLDIMHGGMLMTFADHAMFHFAQEALRDADWSVTATFNCEFLGPAKLGELVEARGEVTKGGGSLVFVRGMITAEGRPCLAFSGAMKKGRART